MEKIIQITAGTHLYALTGEGKVYIRFTKELIETEPLPPGVHPGRIFYWKEVTPEDNYC